MAYEQFLEALLEAEVFAREAAGARMRIRHAAFPPETLEDFNWAAQPSGSTSAPRWCTFRLPILVHFSAAVDNERCRG
jgi:hypothetical protein